jgi:hypothetical protein
VSTTISKVSLAAAHEGDAELIVTLTYDNGGESTVPLDAHASHALLSSCQSDGLEGLIGQEWQHVRAALSKSFNRFQK